jgi:hypothetical protein
VKPADAHNLSSTTNDALKGRRCGCSGPDRFVRGIDDQQVSLAEWYEVARADIGHGSEAW